MFYEDGRDRAEMFAEYLIDNHSTVRDVAKHFDISKSTVHKDISSRLYYINPTLFAEAKAILEQNKSERHLRGGEATKKKYMMLKNTN